LNDWKTETFTGRGGLV